MKTAALLGITGQLNCYGRLPNNSMVAQYCICFQVGSTHWPISSSTERGIFDPSDSDTVSVVPSETTINNFNPHLMKHSKDIKSGMNHEVIDLVLQSKPQGAELCLKFYVRKINPGFQDDTGEIDLIGCKSGPTLPEKQQEHVSHINFLTHLINEISLNSIPSHPVTP